MNCKGLVSVRHCAMLICVVVCVLALGGCRYIKMTTTPESSKQGDNLSILVQVGDKGDAVEAKYKINGQETTITTFPQTVSFNTCRTTGTYITTLNLSGEVTYNDGEKKYCSYSYDLTEGLHSREDADRTYVTYLAEDPDSDTEDLFIEIVNAFQDEFDSYSETQYYWADPYYYTGNPIGHINSADMAINMCHGNHHIIRAGDVPADIVDISQTELGNFAPCGNTGDLEYMVFLSCLTLSLNDSGGNSFWHYWFKNYNTRMDNRPFTGLHMALGFRTLHVIHYWDFLWWGDNDSADFTKKFAKKLDSGNKVRSAWLYAADEELSYSGGDNKTAVIYLDKYKNDKITSVGNDYIYGNSVYSNQWVEYWD